jgi:hypothetical protein
VAVAVRALQGGQGLIHPTTLTVALLLASAALAVAILSARRGAALLLAVHADRRRSQRMEARTQEASWIGAVAQRWILTPAALGGGDAASTFETVTLDALGLANDPLRPAIRRTDQGLYQLIPVGPCRTLASLAARAGTESVGGLLVVGTGATRSECVATLVMGPLVQITLPEVPWAWIQSLTATPVVTEVRPSSSAVREPRRVAPAPCPRRLAAARPVARPSSQPSRRECRRRTPPLNSLPDPHTASGPGHHRLPARDPPGRAPPFRAPP